jgi:hypothetical protein
METIRSQLRLFIGTYLLRQVVERRLGVFLGKGRGIRDHLSFP